MAVSLVLSLFPGLDLLGTAFEQEGFCTVAGPDVVWGRDVRTFHPPVGKFDGVIGGPPCQTFSTLANLVRAKGLEPRFGNLIPEFVRCVEEAAPEWFLMENVPGVPEEDWPVPKGYDVHSFVLCNSWLDSGDGFGEEQMRKRRFWFGLRCTKREVCGVPDLRRWIRMAVFELPKAAPALTSGPNGFGSSRVVPDLGRPAKRQAVTHSAKAVPVKLGGSGKVKRTAVCAGHDGAIASGSVVEAARRKRQGVTGRHEPNGMGGASRPGAHAGNPPRYTIQDMLRLQGLPEDALDEAPFTMQGKRKLVGNGVPISMGRALARAVRKALDSRPRREVEQ